MEEKNITLDYLDTIGIVIVEIDIDGTLIFINKRGCEVLEYERDEVIGKNWFDTFVPEDSRDKVKASFQQVITGKIMGVQYDKSLVCTRTGMERVISWHNAALKDEAGQVIGMLSSGMDITARRSMESSQRLAQVGELIYHVGHEINGPLQVVYGRVQLSMMKDFSDKEWNAENLSIIKQQCEKIGDVIDRIRIFARSDKGEIKIVDINDVIRFIVGLMSHQFLLHGVEIITEFVEPIPKINVNKKKLEEVLMNLLRNAADSIEEKGTVRISTLVEGNNIRIDFIDSGCGIPKETMKRMFEPFFTTKEKSVGMGLAVCLDIMRECGGDLKYESEEGKGTTASVFFPIPEDSAKDDVSSK